MTRPEDMSWIEHLSELRRRLMWVLSLFILVLIAGFIVAQPVIEYLKHQPPADEITWNAFSPWDALRMYMNVALLIALVITLPLALYHVWAFVKPGLREVEQRATLAYIPAAFILLLVGISFSYFIVFRMAFYFASGLAQSMGLQETYGGAQYFAFMFNIILPVSLIFEVPIVVLFLTRIRIVKPSMLRKLRRYAYLVLTVLSTIITPPDIISALIVTVPLILLYEIGIILSAIVYRKLQREDAERERLEREAE